MALNRNNSFYANGLRSERDKFGIEQELDRIRNSTKPAYTTPDNNLYRSANAGNTGGGLSNVGATETNASTGTATADEVYENYRKQVNNWFGTGNRVNLDDIATKAWNTNGFDINTTPYAKWSNYGEGNIFKEDFKMRETNDAVKGYYNNTKNLADSEYENYKRMAEQIARQGDAITAANSKAYIAKQQQLKNSREQNMAMGRGGLGTSEAGYNRINTAYENQRNVAIKNGNEIADDTLQAYEDFIKATRVQAGNYENAARDSHGDYIVDDVARYLSGDGENSGKLDALSNKKVSYKDGETDMSVDSYITADEEQKLKDYVNKVKTDNAYFYGGDGEKDADTVFQQYIDLIEGAGSKNEKYQNYLKWDTEQKRVEAEKKAQAELVAPENYAKRGAVANVANAKVTTSYLNSYIEENDNKYKLTLMPKETDNYLKNNYKDAVYGDVIRIDQYQYVKFKDGWRKMELISNKADKEKKEKDSIRFWENWNNSNRPFGY